MSERVAITGASSGIGEATAGLFAAAGAHLFLVARRGQRLESVSEQCRQRGAARVICRTHDLGVVGEGERLVRECLTELGGLDVLICNAGYGVYGPVEEVSPEEMARIWQVNYQSGYESIHAALPHFRAQGRGHIVIVSSVIGKKAMPFAGVYCATKAAQAALGEALWGELRGSGISTSVICPGYTATEFQDSARKTASTRAMRRMGGGQEPIQVARAIVRAVRRRQREVHLTWPGRALCLLDRVSPSFTSWCLSWLIRRSRAPGPADSRS